MMHYSLAALLFCMEKRNIQYKFIFTYVTVTCSLCNFAFIIFYIIIIIRGMNDNY